jgi:hypothetical protein
VKLREVPRPEFDPPPLQLRRWHWSGERPRPAGEAVGAEVYRSRQEWVAARQRWEHQRGQLVGEWYAAAVREAKAERGFDGWAEMLAYRPEPDEDPDAGWDPLRDEW